MEAAERQAALMQYGLSKQYLKAMGVTVWEPRDLEIATASPVQPVVQAQTSQPVQAPPFAQAHGFPVAVGTASQQYIGALADTPVSVTQAGQGELLLVLEPPSLTAESTALLTAMLKAINFDIGQQSIATMDTAAKQTLSAAVQQIKPRLAIIMAGHHGNVASLDAHRAEIHRAEWSNVPVAITIHPEELITDPANKRPAWEDLKRVKALLDA